MPKERFDVRTSFGKEGCVRETHQGFPVPLKSGKSLKEFCLLAHKAGFRLVCKQGGTVELYASPLIKTGVRRFCFAPRAERPPQERRHYYV